MRKMYCIFDFDGTLVDSFDKAIEKLNILADEFDFQKICPNEVADLKELNSSELIKYLKIPIYKIPKILYQARKEMKNEILKLIPFVDIHRVLQRLYNEKISLGILTSNSKENAKTWLRVNKMEHFFNFIYSESNFFGKSIVIKRILKKYEVNKEHAFYIGDETRDIEAAKKNGINSIAVTWGFNSEKILLQHKPHYLAREPEDLLKILGL